jgi:hypothetical protein
MRANARAILIEALRDAHRWLDELLSDPGLTLESLASREGKSERSIRMTLSLAFLAPEIVKAADRDAVSDAPVSSIGDLANCRDHATAERKLYGWNRRHPRPRFKPPFARARGLEGRFGVHECHQLEHPSKTLPTVGTRQMRSRVRQNTTSSKMLNPLAWTPARTPCILYAGRRIPRQFQLKDGWTCGRPASSPDGQGVGRLLAADEDE